MLKSFDTYKQPYKAKYPLPLNLQLFAEETDPPQDPPADPPQDPPAPNPAPATITVEQVIAFLGNAKADLLFKIPSVKSLVEHARSEEKDKVYKQLNAKEDKIKDLEKQLKEAQDALDARANENLGEQDILQRQVKALQDQVKLLTDSIEAERAAAEADKRKATFEAYKERKLRELAEAKTEYLPDLLGGETEEEFDASVQKAIVRYAELKAAMLANQPAPAPAKPPKPSTPSVTNPPGSSTKQLTAAEIRNLPPAEYAKHRERILAEARTGNLDK
jgi:Skp family chaperone for outer membrane proteins